jgi:hypothetical protein
MVGYMHVKPDGASNSKRQIPALEATGIGVAKAGTAIWFVIMLGAWALRETVQNTGFSELPQIATAGFLLGLIGLRHVTRRARRLGLIPQ